MITVTDADRESAWRNATARPTRGGYTAPDEPPTPPEPAPLVIVEDEIEPDGPLEIPAHLLVVCKDYRDLESALGAITTATSAKRAFSSQVAWWSARAYLAARDHDAREAVLGELGHTLQKGRRQVQRYIRMGRVFSPDDMDDTVSQAVHLVAASANDPKRALRLAVDNHWNSTQLKHYLEKHTPPPVRETPVNEHYADPAMLEDAMELLAKAWREAAARGDVVDLALTLRVTFRGEAIA